MEKEEQIRRLCEERAREIYGKCLPRRIAGRIDKEMEFGLMVKLKLVESEKSLNLRSIIKCENH